MSPNGYYCPGCRTYIAPSMQPHTCGDGSTIFGSGGFPLGRGGAGGYGCICPPGANLACQAPYCPRKPPVAIPGIQSSGGS